MPTLVGAAWYSTRMGSEKLRVLILYGGDGATGPRNELVSWLVEKKVLNAEPILVSWGVAHSEGTVAERVRVEVDAADKAIAIVTKDARSDYGAPNVLEEIGRWLQARGGRTLCVIREEGTLINSNVAGLVYLSFATRIREAFDDLRDFLTDVPAANEVRAPTKTTAAAPIVADMTISSNPTWVLVAQRAYRKIRVDETNDNVTAVVACANPSDESALRGLRRRSPIELTYGNHVVEGGLSDSKISHEAETTARVEVSLQDRHHSQRPTDVALGGFGGGFGSMSAEDIAEQRARRILTGEPRATKNDHGQEMMIRGLGGSIQVTESPIPSLLVGRPRDERATWERVRIELVRLLLLTNCVERIDLLTLEVKGDKLVGIQFRGARHITHSEPVVIEIKEIVNF